MSNLKSITLDGIAQSSGAPALRVRRVERELLGSDRTVRMEVPGRAGAWTFEEESGQRIIRVVGWLEAMGVSAIRTAIHQLATWLDAATALAPLIVSDESDRYYDVTVADWEVDTSERRPTVVIEFVGSAYGLATSASTEAEQANTNPDSDTFTIDVDYPVEPEIEITPTNGTITSFTLTVNGAEIAWQVDDAGPLTINSGQTITISSLSDTVYIGASVDMELTGFFDPDDVDMANVAINGFPELVDGNNTWSLIWTGTATTVDIDFAWRERFI